MTDLQTRRTQGWVPDLLTFGARLALVRQRMGWTNIKEAALACAIAPQTWRMWEAGKQEPRQLVNACMKIAGVTGVDYRWLALGPGDDQPATAERSAGVTHGYPQYHALGERLISTTSFAPKFNRRASAGWSDVRACVRTRPLER